MTPTDIAQMQFGNVEALAAEIGAKVQSLYARQPFLFWIAGAIVASLFVLKAFGFVALVIMSTVALPLALVWLIRRR